MILALDTSTPILSVAAVDGDHAVERTHSAKAGDALPKALLELAPLETVTGIAVGIGPGSFTGLRVGIAAAKALAYARGWPIAGVSSLRALAYGTKGRVIAALEARKGELFVAEYVDGEPVGPERVIRATELPQGAVVLGPGKPPSAVAIARLAKLPAAFDLDACFALAPNYLAPPTAEVALAEGRVGGLPKS